MKGMMMQKIEELKKHDQLILIGTAGTMIQTPWDDPETDYWACSPAINGHECIKGHRIDALFEVHPMQTWLPRKAQLNEWKDSVVLMQTKYPQINNSFSFPLKEIQDWVKDIHNLGHFLTSSLAHMMALAAYLKYASVELWGVHMAAEEEQYSIQREGMTAWMLYYAGLGGRYWIPDQSHIMRKQPVYGYEEENIIILKLFAEKEGLEMALNQLETENIKNVERINKQKGALAEVARLISQYKG
jgi:hypothetical protein